MSISVGEHGKTLYDYLTSSPVATVTGTLIGGTIAMSTQFLFRNLAERDKNKASARSTIIKAKLILAQLKGFKAQLDSQKALLPKGNVPKFTRIQPSASKVDRVTFDQDELILLLSTRAPRLFDRAMDVQSAFTAMLDTHEQYLVIRREFFKALPEEAFLEANGIDSSRIPRRLDPQVGEMESVIEYWLKHTDQDVERARSLLHDLLIHYRFRLKIRDMPQMTPPKTMNAVQK